MSDDSEQKDRSRAEVYRPSPDAPFWYEDDQDDVSLVHLVNVVLRHRWKVAGVPLIVAAIVVAVTLLQPASFTSEASFVPQSGSGVSGQLSQLSGVASQFGINVPSGQPGQSPQFYADLLTSRRLLEEAVTSHYYPDRAPTSAGKDKGQNESVGYGPNDTERITGGHSTSDTAGATLIELYDIRRRSPSAAAAAAAGRLEEAVTVSSNNETGMVSLSVTTSWPAVSRQVAERLIELVNRFNNRVRQTQASEEAEFVDGRLAEARRELRAAEDSLESFLQQNVSWQQSPELRFRHDRLQRRLSLKQQVYTSLATRYEEARISEVKSTPVVTAVTRPQMPVQPDPKRLPLKVAISLVLGGVVGVFWAFGSQLAGRVRDEHAKDYREFLALRKEAAADLRRVSRTVRRLVGEKGSASRGKSDSG